MQHRAYSIFDVKAVVYQPPFYMPTDGAAIRALTDVANDKTTSIGRHPTDFILYCVGTFDDDKGVLSPFSPHLHVMDAVAVVRLAPTPLFDTNTSGDTK